MKNPFSKNNPNGAGIKYKTICKFCQKAVAAAPPLDLPLIGMPDKRSRELMGLLVTHVTTQHPEQFQQGAAFIDEVTSFTILQAFQHEDPSVNPRLERIRAEIFKQTRKNGLNDEDLQAIVQSLGIPEANVERTLQAFHAVRDLLSESGRFSPASAAPAPSPLVLVP